MPRETPVAVTGMGCISAAGANLAETLARLDAAAPCPALPGHFIYPAPHPVFAAPLAFTEDSRRSRTLALAELAASEALTQAGVSAADRKKLRIGVVIGTSVGASLDFFPFYAAFRRGEEPELTPVRRYLDSNPSAALAEHFGCSGPVFTVTNACSSGADAIGLGAALIRSGECDLVLAGGADALSEITYWGFYRLLITSPEPCRPFDAARKGLNLGEGAAFMVLESRSSAAGRGMRPLGHVLGYGAGTDAHHLTAPHPEALGLATAFRTAMRQSGLHTDKLAFINAHGTATPTNDLAEARFFKAHVPSVPVFAGKGGTGHTLGAAGAVEAVLTLAHLARGLVPASPGFATPDPALDFAPVSAPLKVGGSFALSQSLAFGGNNAVLILGAEDTAPSLPRRGSAVRSPLAVAGLGFAGTAGIGTSALLHTTAVPHASVKTDCSALGKRLAPKDLRRLDHFSRLTLLAALEALEEAGPFDGDDTGIILTSGYGTAGPTFDFQDSLLEYGPEAASPLSFSCSVHNIPAAILSMKALLRGPCCTLTQRDAPFSAGLALAALWLREGRAGRVLLGAVEETTPLLERVTHRLVEERGTKAGPRAALPTGEAALFFCLTLDRNAARHGFMETVSAREGRGLAPAGPFSFAPMCGNIPIIQALKAAQILLEVSPVRRDETGGVLLAPSARAASGLVRIVPLPAESPRP